MSDALLEINAENIPARFLSSALSQLKEKTETALAENRLKYKSAEVTGSYKRLAVVVRGLAEKSDDVMEEFFGPPARLLKTADGKFTAQSEGFARKYGVAPSEITMANTSKGDVLCIKKLAEGKTAGEVLAKVFPQVIASLEFPKTMFWEETGFNFARPIRSILAVYDGKVVDFEIAGVKSSDLTFGHSAQGYPQIKISSPDDYEKKLEEKSVIVSPDKRKQRLLAELEKSAGGIDSSADLDGALIEETVFLTENPIAVLCVFDKKFLGLPQELITTVFKEQLKVFPVFKGKNLMPNFIAVRDGSDKNSGGVKHGYEQVAVARLSDADFFYKKDLSAGIEAMRGHLKNVQFTAQSGSMFDKTERTKKITVQIAAKIGANREIVEKTADYFYADLTSEVVREFPHLQWYIGGIYYAEKFDAGDEVSAILREVYEAEKTDKVPQTKETCAVYLAHKIDTICACFASDMIPTGSEDPYGLRRQAFGIARTLLENKFDISVLNLINYTRGECDIEGKFVPLVENFIWQRAEKIFEGKGFKFDEIRSMRAVIETKEDANIYVLSDIENRLAALSELRKNEDFKSLVLSHKRARNITKDFSDSVPVDPAALKEKAERDLNNAIPSAFVGLDMHSVSDYRKMFGEMIALKPKVDKFFDDILVNHEDPKIKNNRLALVKRLSYYLGSIADLSQLQ